MSNPLLAPWNTPHGLPPFAALKDEHFLPAFEAGFEQQNQQVDEIVNNIEKPTFGNTIEALEASGELLHKVAPVFYALLSSNSNENLRKIQSDVVPRHTAHNSQLYSNKQLFQRVEAVLNGEETLTSEQLQLLRETHKTFVRQGAALSDDASRRAQAIDTELATLQTQFGQNVLLDGNDFELVLNKDQLDGLPASVIKAAAREAEQRGKTGQYVFTVSRSSFTPFMEFSSHRELREQMWRAYTQLANRDNKYNNQRVAEKIAALRAERAKLMGYETHAEFVLDDRMAKTPDNVNQLLNDIWQPAKSRIKEEANALQENIQSEGGNFKLAAWDWWYYTEKERSQRFNLEAETLKPYFELARVRDGAFQVATKLYGITFHKIDDVTLYHKDADAFEVKEANGDLIGLFITDYHMRASKKAGAWMNAFRSQHKQGGATYPIILNTCNFPVGDPCLLTMDEVRTLFHEFGHGLHGLLSNVTYRSLAGTAVKRDFVELPSQIMEHWAIEPDVLRQYARHVTTNEVIPEPLIEKIIESQTFNKGFATTEYLAASFLDLDWHDLKAGSEPNADELEQSAMKKIELVPEVAPRYRSSYFQHIFSGGYSAGYYAYIWAEVLDADAFEEFKEKGLFDPATAQSFRSNILEKGGTADPMDLYKRFKGREPDVAPLMANRGLTVSD